MACLSRRPDHAILLAFHGNPHHDYAPATLQDDRELGLTAGAGQAAEFPVLMECDPVEEREGTKGLVVVLAIGAERNGNLACAEADRHRAASELWAGADVTWHRAKNAGSLEPGWPDA